jgi:HSP20 family protein
MVNVTKLPATRKLGEPTFFGDAWRPFEGLRKEVDRLFNEFGDDFWRRPFGPLAESEWNWPKKFAAAPAVDVAETDKSYEITVELPGMDEKNVQVNLADGGITIKGEKQQETEQKKKDYYVSERRYGSFERYFTLPEGVDANKIEATFKNGVLKVMLPKTIEAQKPAKKIEVKAA